MAQNIYLFGVQLPVSGAGVISPPQLAHVNVRQWSGALSADIAAVNAWLEIHEKYTLFFALRWAADANGRPRPNPQRPGGGPFFRLWEGVSANPPQGAALSLRCGPIRVERSDFPESCLQLADGDLIVVAADMPLLNDGNTPMTLVSSAGGFGVDLPTAELRLQTGFVEQQILHRLDVELTPGFPLIAVELFPRPAASIAQTFALSGATSKADMVFAPESGDVLSALHVELRDRQAAFSESNAVAAPLAVSNHHFQCGLRLENNQPVLESLSARGRNGNGIQFHVLGLADERNNHARLGSEDTLHFSLRTGSAGRPSTLLVAATYSEDGAGKSFQVLPENDIAYHGFRQQSRFGLFKGLQVRCDRALSQADPFTDFVDPALVKEFTAPWLDSKHESRKNGLFRLAKPGQSYTAPGSAKVATFSLGGTRFALPAMGQEFLQSDDKPDAVFTMLDKKLEVDDGVREIVHETYFRETPAGQGSKIKPVQVFFGARPEFEDYDAVREYGPFKLQVNVPQKGPDYLILDGDNFINFPKGYELMPGVPDFKLKSGPKGTEPDSNQKYPFAILKLSPDISLEQIFRSESFDGKPLIDLPVPGRPDKKVFDDAIDQSLKQPGWTGLMMLCLPLEKGDSLAARMVPEKLHLAYVAVTGRQPTAATQTTGLSVHGRLLWKNDNKDINPQDARSNETRFRVNEVDIAWADSQLSSFYVDSALHFASFFGMPQGNDLSVIGSYDRPRNEIRFLGQLAKPLKLLPVDTGFGPIKQLSLNSAEIKIAEGSPAVHLNGDIELQNIDIGAVVGQSAEFKTQKDRRIRFKGLQIVLPQLEAGGLDLKNWKWLEIRYPSLQLDLDLPPFDIGLISVKLGSFWVDWRGTDAKQTGFDWSSLVNLKAPDFGNWTGPSFVFDLRMELMKLPELATKLGLPRLTLDFYFGLWLENGKWTSARTAVGIRAIGFDRLNINLMRFLDVRAETLKFGQAKDVDGGSVTALKLVNLEILILERSIISGLTAYIFAGKSRDVSFALFMGNENGQPVGSLGPIQLRWILIGHQVSIAEGLATQLMDVGTSLIEADANVSKAVKKAADEETFIQAGTRLNQGGWVFAAAFQLGELLDAKFLFQDQAYYGIALGGGIFKRWFGYDIAISVLYIKAAEPNQDAFRVTLRVPRVTLPTFQFTGGELSLQIGLDGSFLMNVGFPQLLPNGSRQWQRALGAIVTPLQGSGGFYIQKFNIHRDVAGGGLLISAGYALQAGLGGAFGGGIFTAWVTAGFYYILEGAIFIREGDVRALRLVGAVGILVRGGAQLNWWVISISVEIMISAEARITLSWGTMPEAYHLIGSGPLEVASGHGSRRSGSDTIRQRERGGLHWRRLVPDLRRHIRYDSDPLSHFA